MTDEATLAIEDTTLLSLPSFVGGTKDENQQIRSLRSQLAAAHSAQQMFHESEIQRYEGMVQTLMRKIDDMTQEDQGVLIRIQE